MLTSAPAPNAGQISTSLPSPTPSAPLAPSSPWKLSNFRTALIILAVMSFMAIVATIFVLETQSQRRANDSGLRKSRSDKRPRQLDVPDDERVSPIAPLDMETVKYLPADVDAVAGLHMTALLQDKEARQFLQREIPLLKGSVEKKLLKRLEELTGIPAEGIDHLAIGARLSDQSLTMALRTRTSYDADKVIKNLRAEIDTKGKQHTIYRFRQELLPTHSRGLVNCLDERILLLTWEGKKDDIRGEKADEVALRPELLALLKERLKPIGPVWMAATLDPKVSQGLNLMLGVGGIPEAQRKLLTRVRSFVLWLTLEQPVTVRAVLQASETSAAMEIGQYLNERTGATFAGQKEWVTLQYRARE